MNNTSVDSFLQNGCGRCELYQTPQCKVHRWTTELQMLRELVRQTELVEEMKWGSPCYTLNGRNVLMLAALRDFCAISFLNGAALVDERGLLQSPGPNSRYARYLTFTSISQISQSQLQIAELVEQAIQFARSGARFSPPADERPLPDELVARLESDPQLQQAFDALTPGRQRSHLIYIDQAKSTDARERRVERCVPRILLGKGFNEY